MEPERPEPTGDCYVSAAKYLLDKWKSDGREEDDQFILVHGRPTLAIPPHVKYGHAWIEVAGEICFDTETGVGWPRKLFYVAGRIDPSECCRYTFADMQRWVLETEHWGPWEGPETENL